MGTTSPHLLDAEVLANRELAEGLRAMTLAAEPIAREARAGQFVQVRLPEPGRIPADGRYPFLPRPLAIAGAAPSAGTIELLYLVVGRGTQALAGLGRRSRVRLWGPLGKPFRPVAGAALHLAIGGGTGVAALLLLSRDLAAECGPARRVLVVGARSRARHPVTREYKRRLARGTELVLASEDGSVGRAGTALDAAEAVLAESGRAGKSVALYAAGPEGMLRALAARAREAGYRLQVSLEARMACGVGACRSCVVDGRTPHPESGLLRRAVCADGPVFDAEELAW